MKALLWKKFKSFKNDKIKIVMFFVLPIAYMFTLIRVKCNPHSIIAFYMILNTFMVDIAIMSMEEQLAMEALLSTNMTIKKIWKFNITITAATSVIYSLIILVFTAVICNNFFNGSFKINRLILFQNLANVIFVVGILGCSMIHFSDYSFFTKLLASIVTLPWFIAVCLFPMYSFNTSIETIIFTFVMGILLTLFSYIIISLKSNNERFIINSQKDIKLFNQSYGGIEE